MDDLNDIVTKVTTKVLAEMSASEGVFEKSYGVADLKAHVGGLGKGADSAWEISYKTSSLVNVGQVLEAGKLQRAVSAWEISYKTSAAANIEQIKAR
jgi:hypothetical protein